MNLSGASFELRYMRIYKNVVMKDVEKTKQIVQLLDDGDPIKISFCQGQNDSDVDTLHIPDEFLIKYEN